MRWSESNAMYLQTLECILQKKIICIFRYIPFGKGLGQH